jgi:hypothetical protein
MSRRHGGETGELERSTIEAYVGIALAVVVGVFPLNWYLKCILLLILVGIICDVIWRIALTRRRGLLFKCLVSLLGVSMLIAISWPVVKSQYLTDRPVTIYPREVVFTSPVAHDNYLFRVASNSDSDLYSVEIEFRMADPLLTFDDLALEIPTGSVKPMIEGSKLADIRGLKCQDANGHRLMLLSIYRLAPHESREISFTRKRPQRIALTASVAYFSEEVQSRIAEPNKMKETFHINERMTCSSAMGILLDGGTPRSIEVTIEKNAPN